MFPLSEIMLINQLVNYFIMRIRNLFKSFFNSSKDNQTMNPKEGQEPKKFSKEELKKRLTPEQYRVTQENGTEYPYKNKFNKFYENGVYKCVVCGVKLFSSEHKFNSGCGWPAFFDELKDANIRKIVDKSHGMIRTEVRCGSCDSHLGHLFDDGPQDKTGVRYCVNSASMDFSQEK